MFCNFQRKVLVATMAPPKPSCSPPDIRPQRSGHNIASCAVICCIAPFLQRTPISFRILGLQVQPIRSALNSLMINLSISCISDVFLGKIYYPILIQYITYVIICIGQSTVAVHLPGWAEFWQFPFEIFFLTNWLKGLKLITFQMTSIWSLPSLVAFFRSGGDKKRLPLFRNWTL